MASRSSSLPWAWALETLSTFKDSDTDLLRALLNKVSDFSSDSFKITRERVSLRYIEEWLDSDAANGRNALSIEVSERSEDVLRKVVTSSDLGKCGTELKHVLSQFILQKRATLPEHALDQLKDSILEGCLPSASSLMERSCLAKENGMHCLGHSRISANSSDEYQVAKRLKVSTVDGKIQSLKQNLALVVPQNRNGILQQDPPGRILRSGSRMSPQIISVHDKKEHLLGGMVSANDDSVQLLKRNSIAPDNRGKMPRGPLSNGTFEHVASHQNICIDETRYDGEHDVIPETSSSSDGDHNPDSNYPNDKMISAEKHRFLSSQNPSNNDSLTTDWTEERSCIKCDGGGQVLICSHIDCTLSVHEGCLDSSVSFEENGEFYCPFCSYSRAYSSYREAKQKAALARKALSIFMGRDLIHVHWQKQPVRVPRKLSEVNSAGNANCPVEIHADQQHREIINNSTCNRVVKNIECNNRDSPCGEEGTSLINRVEDHSHMATAENQQQKETSIDCNNELAFREVDKSLISERDEASLINGKSNSAEIVGDGQCVKPIEHHQQVEPASACKNDILPCREAERTLISEINGVSPIKDKSGNAEMVDNHPCIIEKEFHKKAEAAPDDNVGKAAGRESQTSPIEEGQNLVRQQASNQQNPSCSRNQNREDISSKCIVPVPSRHYSNPTNMRRNKLLWTAEEEEVLEEAVQKFSKSGETSMPWRMILDFGRNVFQRTRTPVDLKDKWRNIMMKRGLARKQRPYKK
ncbi:uncharacterized protein LOC143888167 [Tasmannia lanceolata]|uniref:uncharacterized protein LOC143888167 n=1 Tax=Tasmannia lanceolata TaxID=3420 RepID=UPI00406350D0